MSRSAWMSRLGSSRTTMRSASRPASTLPIRSSICSASAASRVAARRQRAGCMPQSTSSASSSTRPNPGITWQNGASLPVTMRAPRSASDAVMICMAASARTRRTRSAAGAGPPYSVSHQARSSRGAWANCRWRRWRGSPASVMRFQTMRVGASHVPLPVTVSSSFCTRSGSSSGQRSSQCSPAACRSGHSASANPDRCSISSIPAAIASAASR